MNNQIPDDYPHFCSICGDTFNGIPMRPMLIASVTTAMLGLYQNRGCQLDKETIRYSSTGFATSAGTKWVGGYLSVMLSVATTMTSSILNQKADSTLQAVAAYTDI